MGTALVALSWRENEEGARPITTFYRSTNTTPTKRCPFRGQRRTYRRPCGMSALLPSSDIGDSGSAVRLVPGLASLRPSQVAAQDSAGRLLPKQGRRAWEVEEELEEELEGVLFATPGRPAREDLNVGCWK